MVEDQEGHCDVMAFPFYEARDKSHYLFRKRAKQIWDSVAQTYIVASNITTVYELKQ